MGIEHARANRSTLGAKEDVSGNGYLRTVCDYVHLNPVRAKLLDPGQRLLEYPCSSFGWYLAAPQYRPTWLRVDRLLGEHGIQQDTEAGRKAFEQRMELRKASESDEAESDEAERKRIQRGWCLGAAEFKDRLLARMEGKLGEHHGGELKRESVEKKGERIILEELERLGWKESELRKRAKGDIDKMAIAARLRRETTLTMHWVAARLHCGTWKSLTGNLYRWKKQVNTDSA